MKFQKGLLTDSDDNASGEVSLKMSEQERSKLKPVNDSPAVVRPGTKSVEVEKDRLFETVEKTKSSSRKYLVLLGVVTVVVLVAGVAGSYYMSPGIGDRILAPKGLEIIVREHMLTKQKRDSTDISFYRCEGSVWARVGVETRTDLPNPVFRIGTYAVKATPSGENWEITAAPISSPEMDVPCK